MGDATPGQVVLGRQDDGDLGGEPVKAVFLLQVLLPTLSSSPHSCDGDIPFLPWLLWASVHHSSRKLTGMLTGLRMLVKAVESSVLGASLKQKDHWEWATGLLSWYRPLPATSCFWFRKM